MKSKRILGIIFIILAIVLSVATVGLFPSFLAAMFGIFRLLTDHLSAYQVGEVSGKLIYWAVHFVVLIGLWRYGIRWSSKHVNVKEPVG
ncbi:MAG: hypothetical protein ACTHK8_20500 [Ginsengibacter sp.]